MKGAENESRFREGQRQALSQLELQRGLDRDFEHSREKTSQELQKLADIEKIGVKTPSNIVAGSSEAIERAKNARIGAENLKLSQTSSVPQTPKSKAEPRTLEKSKSFQLANDLLSRTPSSSITINQRSPLTNFGAVPNQFGKLTVKTEYSPEVNAELDEMTRAAIEEIRKAHPRTATLLEYGIKQAGSVASFYKILQSHTFYETLRRLHFSENDIQDANEDANDLVVQVLGRLVRDQNVVVQKWMNASRSSEEIQTKVSKMKSRLAVREVETGERRKYDKSEKSYKTGSNGVYVYVSGRQIDFIPSSKLKSQKDSESARRRVNL